MTATDLAQNAPSVSQVPPGSASERERLSRLCQTVLALLRHAGHTGVTSGGFADSFILSYSQRLGDLKRLGYDIRRERVKDSSQYRWWLVE